MFSFGHCPNYLSPPLGPLFWTSKTTFCAYDWKTKIADDNDGYNDNYGNFDDNYDKNY